MPGVLAPLGGKQAVDLPASSPTALTSSPGVHNVSGAFKSPIPAVVAAKENSTGKESERPSGEIKGEGEPDTQLEMAQGGG
jgi:hypothetical protein